MAFGNLQKLGEEKITQLRNELLRGTSCIAVARMIQSQWGDLVGVAEKTLTQMLQRYKDSLIDSGMAKEEHKAIVKETGSTANLKMLRGASLPCLQHLVALAGMQEMRIQSAWTKEQHVGMPLAALNVLVNDYKSLMLDIQKMQFDLGIDEFHGAMNLSRLTSETVRNADGTTGQRFVLEAMTTLDEVFKKRGIYVPQQGQLGPGSGTDNRSARE